MAEPIVVNTGPLVSFARIGCLAELKPLITKAIDAGIWYNRELVRSFLEAAGE